MRSLLALCAALGCASAAGDPDPEIGRPVPTAPAPTTTIVLDSASPAQQPPTAASTPLFEGRFPPPDVAPPHERSAREGDGKWVALGDASAGDRAAAPPAVLYKTVVHPHPVSRFDEVTVVAIDLAGVEIHFSPGAQDPGADTLDPPAGLVPAAHHDALLAVFNGGWQPKHGNWGMMLGGRVLVPPRNEGCTIALYRDGRVRVRSWSALSGEVEAMRAYRQTPPCMIEEGELHALLKAHNDKPWGGHNPNDKTRRRSVLGVDASGRVLFYGFGVEVGAELLALGMQHVGAVAAAEMDINWSWTRFLLFGGAELQVTSTLVPKMTHTKRGYVTRRDERDFFYIVRRR